MIYGYARVSKQEQDLDRQLAELEKYGCDRIITDKITGSNFKREGLDNLLLQLKEDDTIVVLQLDRLGRSLKELLSTIEMIEKKGCDFVSITQGFDTRSITGKLLYSVLGAVAEFERNLLIERTNQGLSTARDKGIKLGRKFKLNKKQQKLLYDLMKSDKTVDEICTMMNISKTTYYRYKNAIAN